MNTIDEAGYFDKRVIAIKGKLGKIIPVIREINRFNIYTDYLIYDKDTIVVQGKTQGIIDTLYKRLRQYEIQFEVLLDNSDEYLFENLKNGVIQFTAEVPINKQSDFSELIRNKKYIKTVKIEKVSLKKW